MNHNRTPLRNSLISLLALPIGLGLGCLMFRSELSDDELTQRVE